MCDSVGTSGKVRIAANPFFGALINDEDVFCAILSGGKSCCETSVATSDDQDADFPGKRSHDVEEWGKNLQVKNKRVW